MGQSSAINRLHCNLCNINFLNYIHTLQWFRKIFNAAEFKTERADRCPSEVAIGMSTKTSRAPAVPPHSAQSTWMAYLRGCSTSSFISKSRCVYFTPGRGSVLSKPSFSKGIQGKDAMVTDTCRLSSNLSVWCDGWEDKFERRNTDTSRHFDLPGVKLLQPVHPKGNES